MPGRTASKLRQDLLSAYLDADKFSDEDIARLKQVHDPRVVDAFVSALADDALSPQEKAALRRLGVSGQDLKGWDKAWHRWLGDQPVSQDSLLRLKHPDPKVRAAALEEYYRSVSLVDQLVPIMDSLNDPDADVRAAAAGLLGYAFGDYNGLARLGLTAASPPPGFTGEEYSQAFLTARTRAVDGLIVCLQGDPHSLVRARAALSLGGLGKHSPQAVSALIRALEDDSDVIETIGMGTVGPEGNFQETGSRTEVEAQGVCKASIQALARIGSLQAIPALQSRLSADDPEVRALAAVALGDLEAVDAVPDLRRLQTDLDAQVREEALNSLRRIDPADVLGDFRTGFEDPDPDVRLLAAYGLAQKADAENFPRIIALVIPFLGTEETQGPVRRNTALGALVAIGLPAVPALVEALKATDEGVRFDAAMLLAGIHSAHGLDNRVLQDAVIAELRSFQGNHPELFGAPMIIPGLITELER